MRVAVGILVTCLALSGCSNESTERRGREALEKIRESMPDVEAKALAQKVSPDQVKQAQEGLRAANEYLGEVNGQLDAVTVNAIEAFQRSHGLTGDGILNEKTQRLLQEGLVKK